MSLFGRGKKATRGTPTYWNESVVDRIQRDAGVDRDTAGAWWQEMLIFLDLAADSDHFISPPERVDVAWHAFILHTRDYEEYCRARYGRVIHHQPTGAADPEAYRRAYELRSEQGSSDHSIWPIPAGAGAGAAVGEQVAPEGGHDVGPAVQDAGSGSGGGFFSNLFGGGGESGGSGGDSGGSSGSGGDSGSSGGSGGDGGGSSCGGGGGCGGGGSG